MGNGLSFGEYPQRISLSIYPGMAMLRMVALLLRQNRWTSIGALIDLESFQREALHRGMHDIFNDAFNGKDPNYAGISYVTYYYNKTVGYQEVAATLKKASEVTRSKAPCSCLVPSIQA